MKRRKHYALLALSLAAFIVFAAAACGAPAGQSTTAAATQAATAAATTAAAETTAKAEEELPWLEYSVDLELSAVAQTLDNPNDVVTPYIENRFRVKVKEVIQGGSMTIGFKERLGTYAAANNLPDVVIGGNENCAYAVSLGVYGDLTPQIEKMENLNRQIIPSFWPRFMNDGKKTQIPMTYIDATEEPYVSDPYVAPMSAWGLWIREDILAKCGYEFLTLSEIESQYLEKGKIAPTDVYQTNPPIKTPEDFYELLTKIKEQNIMVGDTPLLPWTGAGWNQFHMGCMFDFGHWRIDTDTGESDGFLGSTGAKEWYRFLNKLYQEELVDPDFILHKDDQLQSKIASGRAAMGMYIPSVQDAQAALFQEIGPDAKIRYIEWPKQREGYGAFDIFEGGFWRAIIRDDFKDKDRLTQYFDWFYSEEGHDILTWGPEEAGLWEIRDGVKRFKDSQVEEDVMSGITGAKGSDYWGIFTVDSGSYFTFLSKAGICAPYGGVNYADFRRSFPPKLDSMIMNRAAVSLGGYDRSGRYAYGDGSEVVAKASSYYWSKFTGEEVVPLLMAKNEAEFNDAWDAVFAKFAEEVEYGEARKMMADWFKENYVG
jgi:hypothetical protein